MKITHVNEIIIFLILVSSISKRVYIPIYNKIVHGDDLLVLFFGMVFFYGVESKNCSEALAPYFDGGNHLVQFSAVLRNGTVIYTKQMLYSYYSTLTNGDPFKVVRNDFTSCNDNLIQPFSVEKQQISFYDAHGIVLYKTGAVSISPLWKIENDTQYSFNLICPDNSQVLYAFSQDNYFSFYFGENFYDNKMSKFQLAIPKRFDEISKFLTDYIHDHPYKSAQIALMLGWIGFKQIVKKYRSIIPNNTFIEIDLANLLAVTTPLTSIEQWLEPASLYFRDIVDGIRKAADDPKVTGLIFRIGTHFAMSFAHIQEIRDAVRYMRSKGKKTLFYADSFGEFSNANITYYLASAFETIYMSPVGSLCIVNWGIDAPFIKKTLEKLEIVPEFLRRREFKSAANMFTEEKMTPSERESMQSILDSLFNQMTEGIAQDRNLLVDDVSRYFASGPFTAAKAESLKLIDKLAYLPDAYDEIKGVQPAAAAAEKTAKQRKSPKVNTIFLTKYLSLTGRLNAPGNSKKNRIAYINAEGAISCGKSLTKMNGGPTIGAESLSLAIRAAVLDKTIKAIIIRVDSPGGSYQASCIVHFEIERAKKAGKKVIALMGSVAASGGYFISCNADKIVAQHGTITGSIGVLLGKLNIRKPLEKIGVSFDNLKINERDDTVGDNSNLFSSLYNYSEAQLNTLNHELDEIYGDFKSKVAQGRNLSMEQVEEVARGRVWSGQQAFERKLVDRIGGLNEAIEETKELLKLGKDDKVELIPFPRDNLIKQLLSSSAPYNSDELDKRGVPLGISASSVGISTLATPIKMIGTIFSLFNHSSSLLPGQIMSWLKRESNRQHISLEMDSSVQNFL
ncbi:hypothetical protein PPL_02889 [Heterostelium album PN500]|uniref:Peptidase S49 domain-containing protein n=1 Tax=Heterostelium pallidum (strain ATCC 26659 / Pp 5 / PN500) TaxID=670386 RepID=D3B3C3_HETP5|nr:hypothetical protein PPL_02889 [Heterostelium album PN500]EFA83821.1 hypothetical protein PPL_02889 [Heterostelium album PN500]|eukprot:XP_020435938.1 hypothetical protein PPL_02889 [Heterostelium album PN500]